MARKISAKDLVSDVESGLDHNTLMEKYGLSEENLRKLLNQLVAKGLLNEGDLNTGAPEPPRVDASKGSSRPATSQSPTTPPEGTREQSKSEDITLHSIFGDWYESKRGLILLLIFATPIGLYGLYKTSLWPKKTKIAIAIIAGVLSLTALKPALKIWVSGVIGFGAYGLYNILPFGKTARIIAATLAGLLVLGTIVPYIDKDSGKKRVRTQTTQAAPPVVEPVSPRAVPVAVPVVPQPIKVAQQPKPEPKPEPKQKPTSSGKAVSGITWTDVHSKFIEVDTNLTSAQREKLLKDRKEWWQSYKGKWVRWNGSVNNVSSGGTTVKIDMGEGSWGSDIVLAVSPASREKATGLSKDTYITFVGRMNDQPGSLTAMELQEVTIE